SGSFSGRSKYTATNGFETTRAACLTDSNFQPVSLAGHLRHAQLERLADILWKTNALAWPHQRPIFVEQQRGTYLHVPRRPDHPQKTAELPWLPRTLSHGVLGGQAERAPHCYHPGTSRSSGHLFCWQEPV